MDDLRQVAPGLLEFMAEFPSCKITKDDVRLKYIPVSINVPDLPLERMGNLELRGQNPMQLYAQVQRQQDAVHR